MNYALFADENCTIFVMEVPEDPNYNDFNPEEHNDIQVAYLDIIERNKKDAILVANQAAAKKLIWEEIGSDKGLLPYNEFLLSDNMIYEIPDLKVRFEPPFPMTDMAGNNFVNQLAIIETDSNDKDKEPESQEFLLKELIIRLHQFEGDENECMAHALSLFTITRNHDYNQNN